MRTGQILLVEDNGDNRDVLTVMLGEKYRVSSYPTAAEAIEALDTVRPDLLVLDIGMKPVNGLECLGAIRAIPLYATTPAIALTGYARNTDKEEFLAAGFQAVVTKPILDFSGLESLIDRLLGSECLPTPAASDAQRPNGATHARSTLTDASVERIMIARGSAA